MVALLAARVPKPLPPVRASAVLRFSSKRKRDEGNFRSVLEKALGDALQLGWLEDDTPEFFTFGDLSFDEETGTPLTKIVIETQE